MDKKRLDQWLVDKGYFDTKNKAHAAILSGKVWFNDECEDKPGKHFSEDKLDKLVIKQKEKYVSRGGYKLEKAIHEFGVNVQNKICMDVGCSTGGFTDCLLQNGAKKVYAIDVGYGQFDFHLRDDERVELLEKQNIRNLSEELIPEKIDIIVIDVSFISITKFLNDLIKFCNRDFDIIILIKPQFEAEKGEVKKGVISSRDKHIEIVTKLLGYFSDIHLIVINFTVSPIKGPKGNIEFLVQLKDKGMRMEEREIVERIKS